MKNLIQMAFIGLLVVSIASCNKNQVAEDLGGNEIAEPHSHIYHIYDGEHGMTVESIKFGNLQQAMRSQQNMRSQHISANGHYTQASGREVSFSAMENNSGLHGNGQVNDSYLFYDVQFEMECLFVLGNQAWAGGPITYWDAFDPFPLPGTGIGSWLLIAVEDNGEGASAPPDGIGPGVFVISDPAAFQADLDGLGFTGSFCEFISTNFPDPYQFIPGSQPTNIQVK